MISLLEEREDEARLKEVRAAQPGDAGADDGEAFRGHYACEAIFSRPSASTSVGTGLKFQINPVHESAFNP